ncbi:MAG: hypothetical protein JXC33_10515, partial [Deltaproteobacteria bacterium]|nr:hypothetical protein [Deltaproteobacteria bacterium]
FKYPDLALSLDRIWVNVADQNEMTPLLWNFTLQFIGIGEDSNQPSFPFKPDQSYALSFLVSSWFTVLFMNSRQDFSTINSEIENIIDLLASKNGLDPESRLKIYQSHIFSPENIFWNPDQHNGHEDITNFLTQSVDLGFLLIKNGIGATPQWSQTDFWIQYEQLMAQIKNVLFTSEMEGSSVLIPDATKDIYNILVRIARKWRGDMETTSPEPEQVTAGLSIKEHEINRVGAVSSENVLIKKTVVLTPDMFGKEPPSPDISEVRQPEKSLTITEPLLPSDTLDHGTESIEALPETRIINQKDRPLPPKEPRDDDIPETVVISPHEPLASQTNAQMKRERESTKQGQITPTDPKVPEGLTDAETSPRKTKHDEEDVPETVIINYKKSQGGQ